MVRKLALVLVCQVVLSLGTGACSSAESTRDDFPADIIRPNRAADAVESTDEIGPPSDVVSRLIQHALRSEGSISYGALVERLGDPDRVHTRPVRNQYVPTQTDTLRTLVYTGIRALVYDVAHESKTFLVRLSLLSTGYTTPEGLHVGQRETQVLDMIGPPTRRNDARGELIYEETETTPTSMVLQVRNGRVVRIDWEFYFA